MFKTGPPAGSGRPRVRISGYRLGKIPKALRIHKKSPMTNMPMNTKLYANKAIRDIITGYLESRKLKKNLKTRGITK